MEQGQAWRLIKTQFQSTWGTGKDLDVDWGKKIYARDWRGSSLICWCWWPQKVSRSVSWLPPSEQPLSPPVSEASQHSPGLFPCARLGHRDAHPSLESSAPTLEHPQSLGSPHFSFPWGQGSLAPGTPIHSQKGATWVPLLIHLSFQVEVRTRHGADPASSEPNPCAPALQQAQGSCLEG